MEVRVWYKYWNFFYLIAGKAFRTTLVKARWRISSSELTALKTSSLWPSTPPKIATRVSVWIFHNLSAWSAGTAKQFCQLKFNYSTRVGNLHIFTEKQTDSTGPILLLCLFSAENYLCLQITKDLGPLGETLIHWLHCRDLHSAVTWEIENKRIKRKTI